MRVTSWTEYSLIIAMHLAKHRRSGGGPLAARELAESEQLPPDYVEQILLRLRRSGLVESVRGARGGYLLSRDAEDVTVRDVIISSDQQPFEINCENHPLDDARCTPNGTCAIRPLWLSLQGKIDGYLASVTLADLLQNASVAPALVTIQSAS